MMQYLVTGGAGFIGSHLVEKLVKESNRVVILDDFSNGSEDNISHISNIRVVKGSVVHIPETILSENFDGIFHLATHPRSFSLSNPLKDLEVNAKGMLNILEFAKKRNHKIVFTSNSGICGNPDYVPIDEKHKDKPSTPYDAHKLVSEHYCKIYHKIYGTKSIIFRLGTVYGSRQKVNLQLGWRPLIATLTSDVFYGKKPIIFGTGNQTRDLIHVSDIVNGLVSGMKSDINNADVFLLGTGIETSVNRALEIILEVMGKTLIPERKPETPGDISRMCLNYDKVKNALGFKPKVELKDGVIDYLNWLKRKST